MATRKSRQRKWTVVVLGVAKKEGRKILSKTQYDHIVDVLKRLVDFGDKEKLADVRIERIRSFFELKEKGGVLGRINLRVYFGTAPNDRELIVAMTYKKEDDGRPPPHIVILVEDRLEEYLAGGLRKSATKYE